MNRVSNARHARANIEANSQTFARIPPPLFLAGFNAMRFPPAIHRWDDNNKWSKIKKSSPTSDAGKFIFYAYVFVSLAAGVKGVAERLQRDTSA